MKKILLFAFFLLVLPVVFAQSVIKGNAQQYASENFLVYTYNDYITRQEIKLGELIFDENGDFFFTVNTDRTKLIFFTLNRFKVFLYAEPGKTYTLKLPPRTEITPEQKRNPYFRETEIMAGIINPDEKETNFLIQKFDNELDDFINQNFETLYNKKSVLGNELIVETEKNFTKPDNVFFENYVKYRLGFLDYLMRPDDTKELRKKYFDAEEIQLENPAYCILLKKLYEKFLFNTFWNGEHTNFRKEILQASTSKDVHSSIQKTIGSSSKALNELIFLIGIHNGFYDRTINLVETNKILNLFIPVHNHSIKKAISKKINYLQKGTPAPPFSLKNLSGKNVKSEDMEGKYLLLNFCDINGTATQAELNALKDIYRQHRNQLEIVSFFRNNDQEKAKNFVKEKKLDWIFLFADKHEEILKTYRIRSFPSYIVIDKNQKIIQASAPTVHEGFQSWFEKLTQ